MSVGLKGLKPASFILAVQTSMSDTYIESILNRKIDGTLQNLSSSGCNQHGERFGIESGVGSSQTTIHRIGCKLETFLTNVVL